MITDGVATSRAGSVDGAGSNGTMAVPTMNAATT
jgi:hypothetical protein